MPFPRRKLLLSILNVEYFSTMYTNILKAFLRVQSFLYSEIFCTFENNQSLLFDVIKWCRRLVSRVIHSGQMIRAVKQYSYDSFYNSLTDWPLPHLPLAKVDTLLYTECVTPVYIICRGYIIREATLLVTQCDNTRD